MRRLSICLAAICLLHLAPGRDAEARRPRARRAHGGGFGLRLGAASLDLTTRADTPILAGLMTDAVSRYNDGARAYNAAHGLPAGSAMAAPTITLDDLAWRQALVLVTPTVRSGGRGLYVRVDAPIGWGEGVRTAGLGVYPVNLGVGAGDAVTIHAGAGFVASWVWLPDASESAGGLVQGRLAAGARIHRAGHAWDLEVGYTVRALGGVVDRGRLDAMNGLPAAADAGAPPPPAGDIARGGEQGGMVDVALGVEWE